MNPDTQKSADYLTLTETSARTGMSRSWVEKNWPQLAADGVRVLKIGGRVRINADDLAEWIEDRLVIIQ